MNKLFIILFGLISILAISCQDSKTSKTEAPELKIETYLDTIPAKYEGYKTNSVIREELNNFLKEDFKKQFDKGLLNDLPFKLDAIENCGNKYIANLSHLLSSKYYNSGVLDQIEIEIYAETDEVTAKQLVEKRNYLISGKFKEYITFQNNDNYCAMVLMAPYLGYQKDNSTEEIQFGAIGIQLDSIQEFKEVQ